MGKGVILCPGFEPRTCDSPRTWRCFKALSPLAQIITGSAKHEVMYVRAGHELRGEAELTEHWENLGDKIPPILGSDLNLSKIQSCMHSAHSPEQKDSAPYRRAFALTVLHSLPFTLSSITFPDLYTLHFILTIY